MKMKKSLTVEYDFFWKIVPYWVYFGQDEDFKLDLDLDNLYFNTVNSSA